MDGSCRKINATIHTLHVVRDINFKHLAIMKNLKFWACSILLAASTNMASAQKLSMEFINKLTTPALMKDSVDVYEHAEVPPQYATPYNDLVKEIEQNINLPYSWVWDKAFIEVKIGFVVEKDGKADCFKNIESGDGTFDKAVLAAAKRAITKKWKPATIKGKPVRYHIVVPAIYRLRTPSDMD